ncbi:hypothetical protein Tco_0312758 [Tanacetum coccineum]
MESVQDMSGYRDNQKVKCTAGLFIGKALMWWNSQIHTRSQESVVGMSKEDFKTLNKEFHELASLVPHLVTTKNKRIERYIYGLALQIRGMVETTEPKTIQRVMQKDGTLTNEAIRNGSLKKNPKKRGNGEEPNRDKNARDENKRTRNRNAFATTANPVRREYNGPIPKCISCNLHHPPEIPCPACFNYGRPRHMAKDCRVAPRMVNPVNARNPTIPMI